MRDQALRVNESSGKFQCQDSGMGAEEITSGKTLCKKYFGSLPG